MTILSQILAAVALLASAVIYGTDVFCAIVQRPALAQVSDGALTSVMGRVHDYGDRRMPLPGVIGVTAAALAVVSPPFDCIKRSGASIPIRSASAMSRVR